MKDGKVIIKWWLKASIRGQPIYHSCLIVEALQDCTFPVAFDNVFIHDAIDHERNDNFNTLSLFRSVSLFCLCFSWSRTMLPQTMICQTNPSTQWEDSLIMEKWNRISWCWKDVVLVPRRGSWPWENPCWPTPRRGLWRSSIWSSLTPPPSLVMEDSRPTKRRQLLWVLSRRTKRNELSQSCMDHYHPFLRNKIYIRNQSFILHDSDLISFQKVRIFKVPCIHDEWKCPKWINVNIKFFWLTSL